MELPPFNYTNPLRLFGGAKQVKYISRFHFSDASTSWTLSPLAIDSCWGCIFVWCSPFIYECIDSCTPIKWESTKWYGYHQFIERKQLFKCHGVSALSHSFVSFRFLFCFVSWPHSGLISSMWVQTKFVWWIYCVNALAFGQWESLSLVQLRLLAI